MAVQGGGPYRFSGKIGTVRGIKFGGLDDWFVGLVGGPTKEQIENDPNFARTRENMSEFGGSSIAARFYRIGANYLRTFMWSYFSGQLNAQTLQVLQNGPGPRGEREILFTLNQNLMEQTELNPFDTFGSIFQSPFTMSSNIARNQATLSVPLLVPQLSINAPQGATHYQMIVNAVAMSDWGFAPITGYFPKNAPANGTFATMVGAILTLSAPSASQTVVALIPGSPTMADATMFTTIGIQFYQFVNAVYYPLFQSNVAKIDLLF